MHGILSSALEAGINTLDTARGYGEAEKLLVEFFDHNPMKQPINIVTKFKISAENLFNKEKAREEVYRSVRASIKFMNLKYIPICLFHMDRNLPLEAVLEILPSIFYDLKNEGLIDIAGVSIDHPSEAKLFLEHTVFEAMQVPLNIFDTRIIKNGILNRLHVEGKIVFVRSVFLQGLVFMNPVHLKGNLVDAIKYIEALKDIAGKANISIAQLAFSFINNMQSISSIVFGAVNQEQIKQNVALLGLASLSKEIIELINYNFEEVPEHIITPGLWSLT